MLVECIGNTREHLVSDQAKQAWDECCHIEQTQCEIGKRYIVYGIVFFYGEVLPTYLICANEYDEYPVPEFAEHFKILDGEIADGWVFNPLIHNYKGPGILPKRMANEYAFPEKLVDGDPDAVQYFLELKEIMKEKYKDYI